MGDGQILAGAQYALGAFSAQHSPVDATTYYLSQWSGAPSVSEGLVSFFPRDGQLRRAWLANLVAGTLGTSELGTISLRINNATDYLVSAAVKWDAAFSILYALEFEPGSTPMVVAGDYWEFKIACPTWATNPTIVLYSGGIWIENQ